MKKESMRYLKNLKTGVVFAETASLKKMRKDLVPCTRNGMLIEQRHVDMPYLYNPFTGKLLPNSGDNAEIVGLIPVRDEEHAAQIRASLSKQPAPKVESPSAPAEEAIEEIAVPAPTTTDAKKQERIEQLTAINVYEMDKNELQKVALTIVGEKLDGRQSVDTLREQLQVLINNQVSELAA